MDHRWILILFLSSFHQQQHNCQLDNSCKEPISDLPPPPIQKEHAQLPPVRLEVMPTPVPSVDPLNSNESESESQETPTENVNALSLEEVQLPEPVNDPPSSSPQPNPSKAEEDGPFSANVEILYSELGDYDLPQGSQAIEPVMNGAEETLVNETKEKRLEEPLPTLEVQVNESESGWSFESNETDAFDADPSPESSKPSGEIPETLEPAQVPPPQPTNNCQQYTADSSEATPQLSSDSLPTLSQVAEDASEVPPELDSVPAPLEMHANNESEPEEASSMSQSSLTGEETELPSLSSTEETPQKDSKPQIIEESQPEVPESTSPLPPLGKPSPNLINHFYSTFFNPSHQEVHPQAPPPSEAPLESSQFEKKHLPHTEDLPEPHPTLEDHSKQTSDSSIQFVIQYLISSILPFLPEHLQDSILDLDNALGFTGIIALTLISICLPYYFIGGWLGVRPLKKKIVELQKSLWKVNTAYENQLLEFDEFKSKAYAYDENSERIQVLSMELEILKKLEGKHKETIRNLQKELRNSAKVASQIEGLVASTMSERDRANEERDKLLSAFVSMQESYRATTEDLESLRKTHATLTMDCELERHSNENFKSKSLSLEKELEELHAKLLGEIESRRRVEGDLELANDDKDLIQERLDDLKIILGQYEETVSRISSELTLRERELEALRETLYEDSPFIDIADQKARLTSAEEEVNSLKSRVQSLSIEKNSLAKESRESSNSLLALKDEKDKAENRLQVLEAWFKSKEEELRRLVEKYESEKNIRGKDKEDLIEMIESQREEIGGLKGTIERLKEEFEETKGVHKSELRAIEVKGHDNWLSLCQAERKAQDARKEAEFFRQKLLALTKEKAGEGGDGRNGDFMYSNLLLPPDMIPPPMDENEIQLPSYFGLSDDFMPPPPLPLGMSRHEES